MDFLFWFFKILEDVHEDWIGKNAWKMKSLRRAIPAFDELYANPEEILKGQDSVVVSERLFGHFLRGILLGFLVGSAVLTIGFLIVILLDLDRDLWFPISISAATVAFLATALGMTFLRVRGWCVLHAEGVEFRAHGQTIICPWSLFNMPGEPFVPPKRWLVILPISPNAIERIVQTSNDAVIASGREVKAPHFELRFGNEVMLPARYGVDPEELGKLLLHIGRELGEEEAALPPHERPVASFETLTTSSDIGIRQSYSSHVFSILRYCFIIAELDIEANWVYTQLNIRDIIGRW